MRIQIFGKFKNSRFKFVWYFLKPYPFDVIGITILSIVSALFDGMNVFVLFSILNSVMGIGAESGLGGGLINLTDFMVKFIPVKDKIIAACLLLIISVVLRNIFSYIQKIYSAYAGFKIWKDIQEKMFVKCISADYQYLLDHKHGELIYRIFTAPASLGAMLKTIPQVLAEFAKLVVVGCVLIGISPYASGAIILVGIFYYYFTKYIASNISYHLGRGRTIACERQSVLLNETIAGIRQIKVFAANKRWIREFFKAMQDYFKLAIRDSQWQPLPASLLEALTISMLAIMLIAARVLFPVNFPLLVPILGIFAYAFQKLLPSLSLLGSLRIQIMGILPIVEVLYASLQDSSQLIKDGDIDVKSLECEIKFDNVSFSYPGRKDVLKNVNFSFKKDETTAIVGPSGAGKSTIADLVVRLFIPNSGRVMIDDLELGKCRIYSWLSKIGFVTQDTFIFNASIADNIAFGLKVSRDDVLQAAQDANAHDFILSFPDGYETIVGDRGMKLSGGQRQRIAIARALVHKPEVIILDEATSSLDNVSEALVQAAINKISINRTVIIIAHRLSTVINADKIIVIDKGEVVEEGKHEELILKGSFYWNLYSKEKFTKEDLLTEKEEVVAQ
ncbi:MAG: ABC transporter ATP-binding protein/permease [Candidatus Margulisbacteria bacterium]|nr:ABC transporter ATP-binding protein/permease [Candidatus Margulisiibacteriota bacterium]MBU1021523.1 ABC transporter ATP-binding protein/permease [Candidatus Margulisiibacteriota bacterium]MBU1728608.1 ABC transporter ATP-binding protein/permease [Candidatus Margulisiibacteriota bacterium]MBU1955813.1 ABC transporter ATP-binding protein/permease [Candidatus Margulisiibacteriota bacterium]